MGRPDPRAPGDNQGDLFENVPIYRENKLVRGRHSDAMDSAIAAARDSAIVDTIDDGLLTVLRAGAWALDSLEAQNRPYGPAKILNPLVDALREAHMTPDSRAAATNDAVSQLIEELSRDDDPTTPHTAHAGG